jgi:hypothetical protein
MKNWLALVLLIAAVMVVILYPGITNEIRMTILTIILAAIIGYLGYLSYKSIVKEEVQAEECNTCNGPPPQSTPSSCDECGMNPCQCAQTLPGQSRCPKCDSSSLMPSLPGITSCSSCQRNYRCPGCLLK